MASKEKTVCSGRELIICGIIVLVICLVILGRHLMVKSAESYFAEKYGDYVDPENLEIVKVRVNGEVWASYDDVSFRIRLREHSDTFISLYLEHHYAELLFLSYGSENISSYSSTLMDKPIVPADLEVLDYKLHLNVYFNSTVSTLEEFTAETVRLAQLTRDIGLCCDTLITHAYIDGADLEVTCSPAYQEITAESIEASIVPSTAPENE